MSRVNRAAFKMMKTMRTFVGSTILENDCPICFTNFEPGAKVVVLQCNKLHMLHETCYKIFIETNDKNRVESVCPLCRAPIDKEAVTKKILEQEPNPVGRFDSLKSD